MQQRHTGSQGTKTVMGEEILHHNHWVVSLQTGRFLCIVLINQGPRLHRIYVDLRLCRCAQPMLEMLAKLALLSKICRNPKVGNPKSRKDSKYLATGDFGQEGPPKTLCFIQLFCIFLHAVKCRIVQVVWRSEGCRGTSTQGGRGGTLDNHGQRWTMLALRRVYTNI